MSAWRNSVEAQAARWHRYEEWENHQMRQAPPDYGQALAWMADAWEIASRHSRWWNCPASAEDHWEYLVEVRRRLARAQLRS